LLEQFQAKCDAALRPELHGANLKDRDALYVSERLRVSKKCGRALGWRNWMSLFARAEGNGAETLVLLHGFGGTHHVWDDIAPVLAQSAAVLRYDLPGHGGSLDYPDAGTPKVAAQAILADLAERGIARAHFIGHSMGGAIA